MFPEKVKDIVSKIYGKVLIFVDMDGVVTDYDFDTGAEIKKGTPGIFLNKRPVKTVISIIKKLKDINNVEIYILSACNFFSQADEKQIWLDEHMSFIDRKYRLFVIREREKFIKSEKNIMKARYIDKVMKEENAKCSIMIDDTHDLLEEAKKQLGEKVIIFHVSSLLE